MTELNEMENFDKGQKHNWLYSVNPGNHGSIYLVAYCKNDRKYVTIKLRTSEQYDSGPLRNADVPVWGCEPID